MGVVRCFFVFWDLSSTSVSADFFVQVVISIKGGSEEDVFTEEITTFVISVDGEANDSKLEVTPRVMKYTLVEYMNLFWVVD